MCFVLRRRPGSGTTPRASPGNAPSAGASGSASPPPPPSPRLQAATAEASPAGRQSSSRANAAAPPRPRPPTPLDRLVVTSAAAPGAAAESAAPESFFAKFGGGGGGRRTRRPAANGVRSPRAAVLAVLRRGSRAGGSGPGFGSDPSRSIPFRPADGRRGCGHSVLRRRAGRLPGLACDGAVPQPAACFQPGSTPCRFWRS